MQIPVQTRNMWNHSHFWLMTLVADHCVTPMKHQVNEISLALLATSYHEDRTSSMRNDAKPEDDCYNVLGNFDLPVLIFD